MPIVLIHQATPVEGRRTPRMADEPGVRLGLAHAVLVVVVLVSDATHVPPGPAVVLLILTAGACARTLPSAGSLLLALSAWALWNGFVENRAGQLTLAPHDLTLLGVALVSVLAGSLAATMSAGRAR